MSNSSLVSYTKISPNKNSPRNNVIDTITIHCYVGQASVESMGEWFAKQSTKASCNYGIGYDGRIVLIVEETDRSWCSSSSSNDNRAVTIECACDSTHPYKINDRVWDSLIKLCADICRRNGIPELKWRDDQSLIGQPDKQNMTVHRWFANKACPGDYIYSHLGQIAAEVNAILGTGGNSSADNHNYPDTPFEVQVLVDDLNYRSEPIMDDNVRGHTGKGVFTIVQVSNGWGKLKSGAGWIWLGNSAYCTIRGTIDSNESSTDGDVPFKVKVDAIDLNIRTGPGTGYATTGEHTGVGVFTITEVKPGSGSVAGWGKLKSGAGWISMDYAKRI